MSEVSVVLQMYQSLSQDEKMAFLRMLGLPDELTEIIDSETTEEFLSKHRFPHGEVCCVHCGNIDIKKNGRTSTGRQRFYCKGCHQSFTYATGTIFAGAKRGLDTYLKYVHCMMLGLTVRDTANECHISKNTSFYLRHKILDALQEMHDKVVLDGIVEGDEAYFSISYKGNHSMSKRFVMPREPHMRGEPASKRGLSKEKICVPCAVNRDGKAVSRISCLGKPSIASIENVLGGHIEAGSVFCTDRLNSYVGFAERNEINLLQIKSKHRMHGALGIQRINGYHGQLKDFMVRFHGVATKYLNNYLVWNNLRNYARGNAHYKESIWNKHNATALYWGSKWTYMDRPPIPLLNLAA